MAIENKKEVIKLGDFKSKIIAIIGSCLIFAFGILLTIIWVSSEYAHWMPVLLFGLGAVALVAAGVMIGWMSLFCNRIVIDFEKEEVSFRKIKLIRIPFQSIKSISEFLDNIHFHLISGKITKTSLLNPCEQKIEEVVRKLNCIICHVDT